MRSNSADISRLAVFFLSLFLVYGCSSTPIVKESYAEAEVIGGASGFGVLVSFSASGQRYEPCSLGAECWIFGSPYGVYFQISSPELPKGKICFESARFIIDGQAPYLVDIQSCKDFEYDKSRSDYRAYKRISNVDIGFHEGQKVTILLVTRFNDRVDEHKVVVKGVASKGMSNDFMRHVNSI